MARKSNKNKAVEKNLSKNGARAPFVDEKIESTFKNRFFTCWAIAAAVARACCSWACACSCCCQAANCKNWFTRSGVWFFVLFFKRNSTPKNENFDSPSAELAVLLALEYLPMVVELDLVVVAVF